MHAFGSVGGSLHVEIYICSRPDVIFIETHRHCLLLLSHHKRSNGVTTDSMASTAFDIGKVEARTGRRQPSETNECFMETNIAFTQARDEELHNFASQFTIYVASS